MSIAAAAALPADLPVTAPERRLSLRRWIGALLLLDVLTALVATGIGVASRFGVDTNASVDGLPYWLVAVSLAALWVGMLAAAGAYDRRFLASGAEEYRRVINAGVWLTGGTAFAVFVFHFDLSRLYVGMVFPLLLGLTLVERHGARRVLHRQIGDGGSVYRTVAVGAHDEVRQLVKHMDRTPWAGFRVVDVWDIGTGQDGVTHAQLDSLIETVRRSGADTIAVAGDRAFKNGALRALSWRLEGSGIQLLVAPAITDVAGPRIVVRPIQGLPLLIVEDPEFKGARRIRKQLLDRAAAFAALVVLSPILLVIAGLVKLTSRGPVFFKQERVGLHGEHFLMWKFRSMQDGAHDQLPNVAHLNECDNVIFKLRHDPRTTGIGRWLRRHSLDEIPQFWNVVRGQMSLVGPRPPLPQEVAMYGDDVRRRLLVKPGMTGLWQISGRAELPWQETVRLDLFYVENWSVALDLMVMWKTLGVVLHGRGAY